MVKFPEAEKRIFHNVFVCKKCKSKIRVGNLSAIKKKRAKCRKCGFKGLRLKHKEVRAKGKA